MKTDELTFKLRRAKVPRNKKWIYSLVAWMLENQDTTYNKIQSRINDYLQHNKGYYKEYYEVNRTKHNENMKKNYIDNKQKRIEYNRIYRKKRNIVYKLYELGKLSNTSIILINNKLNN